MGCPPSPQEKEESSSYERINKANNKLVQLRKELTVFTALLSKIVQEKEILPDLKTKINLLYNDAQQFSNTSTLQKPNISSVDEDYNTYLFNLYKASEKAQSNETQLETFLCDSRCYLINVIKDDVALIEKYATELESQIIPFQNHRAEDKQCWLMWLKQEEEYCKNIARNSKDKEVKLRAKNQHKKIQFEITRTNALSDAEILTDTTCFGRNEEEFDAEKNIQA